MMTGQENRRDAAMTVKTAMTTAAKSVVDSAYNMALNKAGIAGDFVFSVSVFVFPVSVYMARSRLI